VSPAILVKSQDEYLLCRSAYNDQEKRWSIPKGYLKRREGEVEAAIRILKEQTGIDLTSSENLKCLIPPSNAAPFKTWQVGKKNAGKDMVAFLVQDDEGILKTLHLSCSVMIEGDYVPQRLRGKVSKTTDIL